MAKNIGRPDKTTGRKPSAVATVHPKSGGSLSDAARTVITLAQVIRDYYTRELPKKHPNYPVVRLEEGEVPEPTEEKQLRAFLSALPERTVHELLLVMYLGRGDTRVSDMAGFYGDLQESFGDKSHAVSQMLEQVPLADYLSDGMEELRKNDIDIDNLPLP